jgi:hypothetical protein
LTPDCLGPTKIDGSPRVIAGHFGFAAAVKARERQAPLWALMLACVWLDVVFVPLFAAKVETISVAPGTTGGYGSAIIHADYTHALFGALALSALFGSVAAARWGRRTGMILAGNSRVAFWERPEARLVPEPALGASART